jgi:hypothetical protein
MDDNRRWMYDGWKKSGAHVYLWWDKIKDFILRAFSIKSTKKIRYPYASNVKVRGVLAKVLEECAKKVCKDMTSNWRIQTTNA